MKGNLVQLKPKKYLVKTILLISVATFLALNSKAQCPVNIPTATDGCSYGNGQVTLSASGSTGFYNWYQNPTGGSAIGSGNSFQTPILTATTNYYVAAIDTNTAITFDGANDYIALNKNYNTSGQITQITVEAWIKTTESGTTDFDNWAIVDFDRSEYYNLFVRGDNGEVGFSTTDNTGSIDDFYSGIAVNDGKWHHIVGQYDGTDKIIYIDGAEVARRNNAHSGNNLGTGNTRFGFIGDGSEASTFNASRNDKYYTGEVDEVRIWNTVRTASEISDYMDSCLTGSETGLDAYYNMNEESGSTIIDLTGGGQDGTLFNFNLSTAWVAGAPVSCDCESNRIQVTASIGSSNLNEAKLTCGTLSTTLDAGTGYSSYNWNTGATSQTINTSQAGIYYVTVSGGACPGTDTVSVVGRNHSDQALLFDGSNDYAFVDNLHYEGGGYTEITVETWIKTSDGSDQIIASFDRSEFWRLEINGDGAGTGKIGFDINTSSGILDFGSNSRIDDGNWHHVAAVFDNGTVNIYIDGILDATTNTGGSFGAGVVRYGFLGVGSEAPTENGTTGPTDYFNGEMDEFRIWSTARSQTEIRDNMVKHIIGNTPGLLAYYKFNNGSGATVLDYSTTDIHNAIMNNFGSSPWVISGAPIGDESVNTYPGSWTGQMPSINSCDGETFTLSNMTGTPDGVHLYYVHAVPNNLAGVNMIPGNDRYFGVFKVNDPTATYTATYNYTGNPYVNGTNEPDLVLFKRSDNATPPWVDAGATLNTTANTLIANGVSTEYILGTTTSPLPIELLSFDASVNEDKNAVNIHWSTASEINNDFFTIERSHDGKNWETLTAVDGAGQSSAQLNYEAVDHKPYSGTSYYRLQQTDFNGTTSFSNAVSVHININEKVTLYPNPAQNQITIQSNEQSLQYLSITSVTGQDVTTMVSYLDKNDYAVKLDISRLNKGVYIIKGSSFSIKFFKK